MQDDFDSQLAGFCLVGLLVTIWLIWFWWRNGGGRNIGQ